MAPGLSPLRPVTAHLGQYQVRKGGCGSGQARWGCLSQPWTELGAGGREGGQVQGAGGEEADSRAVRASDRTSAS